MRFLLLCLIPLSICMSESWNVDADGNWNVNTNWSPMTIPNGVDATATLGNVLTAPRNITLGQDITIGSLTLDSTQSYAILAGNDLILDVSTGSATLNVLNTTTASQDIQAPIKLNDTLEINANQSTVQLKLSNAISGAGGLTKRNSGNLTLQGSNANIYTGTTTLEAGGLVLSKPAGQYAIPGDLNISGGTLTCNASNLINHTSNLTMSGGIFALNSNTATVNNFTMSGGALSGNTGNSLTVLGNAAINGVNISSTVNLVLAGSNLNFNGTFTYSSPLKLNNTDKEIGVLGTVTLSDQILNGAEIVKTGSGELKLTGSSPNQMTGISIEEGTVTLDKSAGVSAVQGTVKVDGGNLVALKNNQMSATTTLQLINGILDLHGTDQIAQSLIMEGGTITEQGIETLTLTEPTGSAITFSNPTLGKLRSYKNSLEVSTWDLSTAVDITSSSGGDITVDSSVAVARISGDIDLGAVSRQIHVSPVSELILDAAMTADAGFTLIGGGIFNIETAKQITALAPLNVSTDTTLKVKGIISAPELDIYGMLKGTGLISAPITKIYGKIAPGLSIDEISFAGDLTLASGSTTEIDINPTDTDLINIAGSLTIEPNATLTIIPTSGNYPSNYKKTIIITTDGVTGQFNPLANPRFGLDYANPNEVQLILLQIIYSNLVHGGNPGAVAEALDLINPSPGSDLDSVLDQATTENPSQLTKFFNMLHPAQYKALLVTQEKNSICFANGVYSHLQTYFATTDQRELSCVKKKDTLWIDGFGDFAHQKGRLHNAGFDANTGGVLLGFDRQWVENFYAGCVLGFSFSDLDWKRKRGDADILSGYGGLYNVWYNDITFLESMIYGGFNSYSGKRNIHYGSLDRQATFSDRGWEVGAQLKNGYFIHFCPIDMNPYISFDYAYLVQRKFSEQHALSLNLDIARSISSFLRGEIGLDLTHSYHWNDCQVIPDIKLAASKDVRFKGSRYHARFENTDPYFTVTGIHPNRVQFAYGLGLTVLTKDYMTILLRLDGEVSSHYWNQNLNLTLSKDF